MAETDSSLQSLFWYCVVPIVGIYVLCRIFKPQLNTFYAKMLAWINYHALKKMGPKIRPRKVKLFGELQEIAEAKRSTGETLKIVEIGAGSGTNFEFYPKGTTLICVDPNPHYGQYLQKNGAEYPHIKFQAVLGGAEDMSCIHDNSVDAVIATLVLCSVNDAEARLGEIKRLLKPGAKFYYLEHIAAKEGSFIYKFQRYFREAHRKWGDNCDICLDTRSFLENAGFSKLDHEQVWAKETPFVLFHMRTILVGKATK